VQQPGRPLQAARQLSQVADADAELHRLNAKTQVKATRIANRHVFLFVMLCSPF
jgi:hypothetical protein